MIPIFHNLKVCRNNRNESKIKIEWRDWKWRSLSYIDDPFVDKYWNNYEAYNGQYHKYQ